SEPTSPSTPPRETTAVVIYGCDREPVSEPDYYLLMCGDAGEHLSGLTWSGWGEPTATATATFWRKSCRPNCAAANAVPSPATVTVGGLDGGRYGSMKVVAPQDPDVPTQEFTLAPDGPIPVPGAD